MTDKKKFHSDRNLSIHHIGGRAGTREFPIIPLFEQDIENVIYEADESCIEQIYKVNSRLSSRTTVIPYCIYGYTGQATFNIVKNRYGSTLKKLLNDTPGQFYYDSQFSWENDPESMEIDETININVYTLDHIFNEMKLEAKAPDFLSLDVEGAEYDILASSRSLLTHKTLAVKAEVNFIENLREQNLFEDIRDLLKIDYHLADLKIFETDGMYERPLPIGQRSSGINGGGEALFIKKPENIVENHEDPVTDLIKAAFISFVYFKLEKTAGFIDALLKNYGKEVLDQLNPDKNYLKFMKEYILMVQMYPSIYPVKFTTILPTPESRKNRFTLKEFKPDIDDIRKRYFEYVDLSEFKKNIYALFNQNYIGIELLCSNNNLLDYAEKIKAKRIQQIGGTLGRLGFVKKMDDGNYTIDKEQIDNFSIPTNQPFNTQE